MDKRNAKGWLYLLPAIAFLGVFMVYPLVDVFVYSFEEGYNSASQTFSGVGLFNYRYVLRDPYFLQALKNTFILVIITVPVSTGLALLISLGLSSIEKLRGLFQTVYFLPYVTNTLAVGLVFMILFKKTAYTDGLVNVMLHWFGSPGVDFIDGPYWAKMFVLCFYTVWIVMPFKILILPSALASVNQTYYNAARVDGTSNWQYLWRIMVPMAKPALVTIGILNAIACWNSFLWTVMATNKTEVRTLPFGLYAFMSSSGIRYERLMAAATIVVLPMILLFICFRKQIVTGVSRGGLKG